jgi:uncharacterized membrane protein
MERKMNRGYYIPMITGTVGMILHFAYLPLLKYAHGADEMALLAGKVHIVGGVLISLTFAAMTWVLSMEGHTKGAIWSVIGHIALLLAIPLHSYGWHTFSGILYQSVVVVFAPVMLYFMVDVFGSYKPGGRTMSDWETDLSRVSAALFALEKEQRQAKDKAATAKDGIETQLRQELDALRGELATLQAIEANRTKMREAKAAQRAKGEPGPAIENDSKLAKEFADSQT